MKFDIKEELIRCSDVLAEVEEVLREKDNDNADNVSHIIDLIDNLVEEFKDEQD